MKHAVRTLLVVFCVTAGSGVAAAGTATTLLEVKTAIVPECKISNVTTLNFGSFGVMSEAIDATATFSLQCTGTTSYSIGISAGNAVNDPEATTSRMLWGDSGLSYDLYRDAGRSQHWGYSSNKLTGTGTGAVETITIYGHIPAQTTTPAPDELEDYCIITVSY
jgi:spore coat protein U-like protein